MDCRKYKKDLSAAAAGGEIAEDKRRALDAHLACCPACAARLARLERAMAAADRAFAESVAAEPSPAWLAGARDRFAFVGATHASPLPRPRLSPRLLVAAGAALALLVTGWLVHAHLISPITPSHVASPFRTSQVETAARTPNSSALSRAGRGTLQRAPTVPTSIASKSAQARMPVLPSPRVSQGGMPAPRASHPAVLPPAPAATVGAGLVPALRPPRRVPGRRESPAPDTSILAEAKIPPEGPAIARLVELIDSGKVDPKSLFTPMPTKIEPIVIKPIKIKPISIPLLEIGGEQGSAQGKSASPTSSGAPDAGANKEITP